jgi:predicted RNA-binding Zn-ribbon protein involved in translation (DUF1610 family)
MPQLLDLSPRIGPNVRACGGFLFLFGLLAHRSLLGIRPHWTLAGLVFESICFVGAAYLFTSAARLWRAQAIARKRASAGHCPECGYDLRASHVRCPECGSHVMPAQ